MDEKTRSPFGGCHRSMPNNSDNAKRNQTRIFYRNLHCFELSQGRCEQSLYTAFAGICGVFFASSLPTMAHFWARPELQI